MSDEPSVRPGPFTLLALGGGLLYLTPKAAGLFRDLGGSKLNRSPTLALSIEPDSAVALGLFLLGAVLAYVFRKTICARLEALGAAATDRPVHTAVALGLVLLALHTLLFVPFARNLLRLPDPEDGRYEYRASRGRMTRVENDAPFEDYTRNLVVARSIRKLGANRYFELHQADELTPVDRTLCKRALRNHPPAYHLFLVPFSASPVVARATSLVLYAVVFVLAFLLLVPLIGARGALLGAVIFWALPANIFFMGMMTSNDLAVAVPILASFALLAWTRPGRSLNLWLAGLLLGIAFLTKYTAVAALPFAFLVLLPGRGFLKAIRAVLPVVAVFGATAVLWGVLLSGTEWGPRHADRYFGRLLERATDLSKIGTAKSTARGGILDFLVFLPLELGFPAALLLAASGLSLLRRSPLRHPGRWLLASLYGIAFLAAFVTIPKSNYIYFAQVGLAGIGGAFLGDRGNDGRLAVAVVLLFVLVRTVLYGLQTYP